MAVKILEIKRESWPVARFIGKKYADAPNWGEWWHNGWFDQLEAAGRALGFTGDAYFGGVHIVNGRPERWIGMLFPAGAAIPDGFDSVDLEPLDVAVCYLYGKEYGGELYTLETHDLCLKALAAKGLKRKEDDWCFERYACSNFTAPDEKGNVILNYAISIEN